jgi:hypothetical protein
VLLHSPSLPQDANQRVCEEESGGSRRHQGAQHQAPLPGRTRQKHPPRPLCADVGALRSTTNKATTKTAKQHTHTHNTQTHTHTHRPSAAPIATLSLSLSLSLSFSLSLSSLLVLVELSASTRMEAKTTTNNNNKTGRTKKKKRKKERIYLFIQQQVRSEAPAQRINCFGSKFIFK